MTNILRFLYYFVFKFRRLCGIIKTKMLLYSLGNTISYKRYRIVGVPYITTRDKGKIVFGDNLKMNNGLLANQIGFNSPCIFRAENGTIFIGDNVGMSQTAIIAKDNDVIIGNHVIMGGGVKIFTTDFHSLDYENRRETEKDKQNRNGEPVLIGDDCFIGAGVIILKGVHIGARSVIGAGSVVTRNIPNDVIAAGNPCKVIREIGK